MLIRIFRNVGNVNVQPQIARVVRVYNYNTPSGITSDIVTEAGQLIGSDGDGSPVALTAPSTEGQMLIARLGQTPKMAWEDVDLSQLTQTAVKTAAYTAVNNDHVLINSSSASADFEITLPASPSAGVKLAMTLVAGHASYRVTVGRNGSNINGAALTPVLLSGGDYLYFEYTGATLGWLMISSIHSKSAVMWHDQSSVISGASLASVNNTSQRYNTVTTQSAALDGDSWGNGCELKAGTYTISFLSLTNSNRGKLDVWVDNVVSDAVGIDFYSAGLTNDVIKTATITIKSDGYHRFKFIVNGKNASSSSYYIALTKIWLTPSAY